MSSLLGMLGLAAVAVRGAAARGQPRSPASPAAGSGAPSSGSRGGLSSTASSRKRQRSESGALASPVPYPGTGSPGSQALSDASAAPPLAKRRGGRSGSLGAMPCMCAMCLDSGTHRLPMLELVHEPGSAVRAWLRIIGVPWKPLAARYDGAKAAGCTLVLRVADRHWRSWTCCAWLDRIYICDLFGGDGSGALSLSSGHTTPAGRKTTARRRMRAAVASDCSARLKKVAEEYACDLAGACAAIAYLRARMATLQLPLSTAEACIDAVSRYIVEFSACHKLASRTSNTIMTFSLNSATVSVAAARASRSLSRGTSSFALSFRCCYWPRGVHAAVSEANTRKPRRHCASWRWQ